MEQPKVSVIIPVYNVEAFLPRCLDSIVGQSLRQIEIICVDDESPDNSIAILRDYAARDSRIRIISQQNKRQGGARNTGFDAATGEFVAFIDSDDWLDVDYFECLYEAAVRYGADIACARVRKVRGARQKWNVNYTEVRMARSLQEKADACHCPPNFNTTNKIYRRDAVVASGIRFRERAVYEDVEYLTQILAALGLLVIVPTTTYWYLVHGNSTTKSRQTPQKQLDKYNAHRQFIAFADAHGVRVAPRYRAVTKRFWSLGPVTLFKLRECDGVVTGLLFDAIPVFRKKLK